MSPSAEILYDGVWRVASAAAQHSKVKTERVHLDTSTRGATLDQRIYVQLGLFLGFAFLEPGVPMITTPDHVACAYLMRGGRLRLDKCHVQPLCVGRPPARVSSPLRTPLTMSMTFLRSPGRRY